MKLNHTISSIPAISTLVFIDAGLEDYQTLENSINIDASVFVLHPEVDGVKQITQTLSQYPNIQNIHIVSHGEPGKLYLGDIELSLDTLERYSEDIKTWFNSASEDSLPVLNIYGCNVAATNIGNQFLERLHQLTQASIFASSTLVGNFDLGGNWELDICFGKNVPDNKISLFKPKALASYAGVFATGNDGKYTFYDSQESGGKGTVGFNDISSDGNLLTVSRDQQKSVSLPLSFNFYGTNFNIGDEIIVGENGGIAFVKSGTAQFRSNNASIPTANTRVASNAIFPFWDDLTGGQIHTKQDGNKFIIQWSDFSSKDVSGSNLTFQVVLHQDSNNIDFIYKDLVLADGATATIGLNGSNGSGLAYSVNQANLNGVTSIRFVTEPQLTINNLVIEEGETVTLSSNFLDATDVDNSDPSNITYTITNILNGEFKKGENVVTTFTQKDINDRNIQFVHDGSENSPSFDIELSDGFNTSNQQAATIDFTTVDDKPVLNDSITSVDFKEDALNANAAIISSNVTLTDIDSSDFEGGNLTINYSIGGGIEDQLTISDNNGITVTNRDIAYNGNVIGNIDTISNGINGNSLKVNFINANANLAAVKDLIQSLKYQNLSDTPNASRTISITVDDGDGETSDPITKEIKVFPENDAPVNTVPVEQNINEDETFTFTGNNIISIRDVDAEDNSVKVKLEATNGNLSLNGITGLNFTNSDGTDDTSIEIDGTISDINNALNGMVYKPNENYNGAASVTITTDDLGNSPSGAKIDSDTVNFNIQAVNDAPVNTVLSQTQTVKEDSDTGLVFNTANGNLIQIDDVDADDSNGTGIVQVTLGVGKGTLTLSSTNGINFIQNTSNGTSSLIFTGKVADINKALDGLVYRGNLNINGADTLNIRTDDLGNFGEGGNKIAESSINITIDAVNDAPINTVPIAQSVDEDTDLIFSSNNQNDIKVDDVDVNEGTGLLEVTVSVSEGILTLSDTTNINIVSNGGNGQSSITFSGNINGINNALDGLKYRGNDNFNGTDTLNITTKDNNNFGEGGILEDSKTVEITVNAVNDKPINTFPQTQTVSEDNDLVFSDNNQNSISVSDIDAAEGTGNIKVTLAVTQGKLTLGQTTGLTIQGDDSNLITVEGTQTDINNALQGLTYRGNQDFNGEDTLTITTQDLGNTGTPGELTKEDSVTIQVSAVNDTPVNTIPQNQTVDEDTDLALTGDNAIKISDVDAQEGNNTVQVELSVAKGILTLNNTENIIIDPENDNGSSTIIFQASVANANIALGSLVYRGNLNVNGNDTLTVTTSDLGNTGTGGTLSDTDSFDITINPVNDNPINTVPNEQTVNEDVQLVFSSQTNNSITISDVDVEEGDGRVEVNLSVEKGTLTLSDTSDLAFSSGDGVDDSEITFSGTVDKVNQALDGLIYQGNQDINSGANSDDTLTIVTSDLGNTGSGGALSDTDTVKIKLDAVNDAPVNTIPQTQIAVDEDTDLAFTGDKLIQVSDIDVNEGAGDVEVTLGVTKGKLTLQNIANLSFDVNNPNGSSTVKFKGLIADVNSALETLIYRGNLNVNGSDTLTVTTNDRGNTGTGGILTDTDSFEITINPVNDDPVIAVPTEQNVNEDINLVFSEVNQNAIKISDVDVNEGTGEVEVKLTVGKGDLTLFDTSGIEFLEGDGLGNKTMTFKGNIDRVNQVIDGLSYVGNQDLNSDEEGEDTLTIVTRDLGNTGKGNTLTDSKTVNIKLAAINDAPINTVPGEQIVDEDTDLVFGDADQNTISVSDIDINDGSGELEVTLGVTQGLLTLKQTTGLTFSQGIGTSEANMTFKGTVADVNSALQGLVYRGNQDVNGEDVLTITTDDLGNKGEGGALTKSDTVQIKINAVNDAPVNTIVDVQTVDEDTDLIFSTDNGNPITVSDVDVNEGTGELEVILSVTQGTLTLQQTAGLAFADDDVNGKPQIKLTGKVADINQALQGLVYRGNENYNGSDTLTITTNDLGNTGSGRNQITTDTIALTVNPVNDPPVTTDVPSEQTVNEDTSLIFNTQNQNAIAISDVDVDGDENQAVSAIQVTLEVTQGNVTLSDTTGLTFETGNENDNGTVIFSGSVENINKALDGLTYQGTQDFNGEDTLNISVNDKSNGGSGGELLQQDTVKINVAAVNDEPVNTIPTLQTIQEDSDLIFNTENGNNISISDIDIIDGNGEIEVNLMVTQGFLTLEETAGLTFADENSNGSSTINITGKITDINQALSGLKYRSNENFNGKDTLTITTNDKGNIGGEALSDTDIIDIVVTPVNDAPVNQIPLAQEVDENKQLIFNQQQGNAISVSDIDADEGTGELEVTLSASQGVLSLGDLSGLSFQAGDGEADSTMTFSGKITDINNALEGLTYQANENFSGQDSLSITTSDKGNFDSENTVQTDIDTIEISVLPDRDLDGVVDSTEEKIEQEIIDKNPNNNDLIELAQKAVEDAGVVALFADVAQTKPIVIGIDEDEQKRLGGESQTSALIIKEVTTQSFTTVVGNAVAAFNPEDDRKSSLQQITAASDIINFEIVTNPNIIEADLQEQIKAGIKEKPVKVEIKLPDDIDVNTILRRKANGTLYDFRRLSNPQRGQLENDMLTGAVLQDRNLDGKADWAVVYLQDGEWGDEDDLVNGEIGNSLIAANLDFGTSKIEVRSNNEGLNFRGNRSYVEFSLDNFAGVEASEVGIAKVTFTEDGQIAKVNGKAVTTIEEAKQAIIQQGETLFSSLRKQDRNPDIGTQTRTLSFEEGEEAVFFTIESVTKDELLFNGLDSGSVKFSLPNLSTGAEIMTATSDESGQNADLSLAGLFDISARVLSSEEVESQIEILAVEQSQTLTQTTDGLIDLQSSGAFDGKQVSMKFSVQREAANNNSAYFYRVDDANGSILDTVTGMLIDPTADLTKDKRQRYLELATTERLVKEAEFTASNLQTTEVDVNLAGGEYYASFLVSDGNLESINNDFSRVLTSYVGINSDKVDHVRSLGNGKFGFEDIIGGGDRDYNDMILSIQQVEILA